MLFTVSTVKDSVANLEQFVARNLAGGVDHMFIFVDDFDPAVTTALNKHAHVTAVATGPNWWHAKRPKQLNARQRINANVTKALLAPFPWAEWLFHIDGDECLQVDRAALAALPTTVDTVRAIPLEAVSRKKWPGGRVTHFKRMLQPDELVLLNVLGVIEEPANGSYFHGHCDGKSGIRPVLNRWLTLHSVDDARQQAIPSESGDFLRLLHYESWSGDDFVRKWVNIVKSGSKVSYRPAREPTAVALRTLVGMDLPQGILRSYLMKIFERTTEDDFKTLLELGLLEEVDPLAGRHPAQALTDGQRLQLGTVLAELEPDNKWPFHTGRTASTMVENLARVAERVGLRDAQLAATLRAAWTLPIDVTFPADGIVAVDSDEQEDDSDLDEAQGSA